MISLSQEETAALDEYDLLQSVCREDFFVFVKEFIPLLIPEEIVWNWHIKFICQELQEVAERVFLRQPKAYDLIVNIPPSTLKSTLCSILWPAWIWTRMPEARIISASYEHILALNFARKSRDIIESEKYRRTFRFKKRKVRVRSGAILDRWVPSTAPDATPLEFKGDTNAKGFYENMAKGDRKSVGTGGQIFGSHSHFQLVDDPMNPKEIASEPVLEGVNRFMDEILPSRTVDKRLTPLVLIMQRLHQNDPTGNALSKAEEGEIRHICLPARSEENGEKAEVKPEILRRRYEKQGGFLDPVRLGIETLRKLLKKLGKFGYAGQFQQNPIPLGGGMFNVKMVKLERRPAMKDFLGVARYWDKAGTSDAGANTAGVKVGIDKWDRIWILDSLKDQWGITERNMMMKQTADADGPSVVIGVEQEPGSGGKESAHDSVKLMRGYTVIIDKVTGAKELRAEPLAGQMGIGNVYVPIGAEWWDSMREEMRFFPVGTLKDQVDAAAGAYSMLNKRVKRGALFDEDEAPERHVMAGLSDD